MRAKLRRANIFKNVCWRNEKGELHREDGSAAEWADGSKEWWVSGKKTDLDKFSTLQRLLQIKRGEIK